MKEQPKQILLYTACTMVCGNFVSYAILCLNIDMAETSHQIRYENIWF